MVKRKDAETWMKGWEPKDRKVEIQKWLFKVIPETPEQIRSGDIYDKAKEKGFSTATISGHLKESEELGLIKRIQKSPKEVYYQRTEESKVQLILIDIQEKLSQILRNPDMIKEWRDTARKAFLKIKITEEMPLDERIRTVQSATNKIRGPLLESYKNLHYLVCLLSLPPQIQNYGADLFIGFTEEGGLHFIPNKLLEEKGFNLV